MPPEHGLHLVHGPVDDAVLETFVEWAGGRVGLDGVLGDLIREARPARVRFDWVRDALAWDAEDQRTKRWWPQGITTVGDHAPHLQGHAGRSVVLTSAYAKPEAGTPGDRGHGARISVLDLTDPGRPRYDHVLLVRPVHGPEGLRVEPVHLHAGGIVWHGDHLLVAGTRRGLWTFRLSDLVRAPAAAPDGTGAWWAPFGELQGHRYLLPQRNVLSAAGPEGITPMRYSFLSLSHDGGEPTLVAGEYGAPRERTRLMTIPIDPATQLPAADAEGRSRLGLIDLPPVPRMQGAVLARGRLFMTTSAGRHRSGSVHVAGGGAVRTFKRTLPIGPEDVCYWPAREQLWSLTEHPGSRIVFALDPRRFER